MSDAKDVKFSLKVMMNKQKTKVLFAEADSDFVDILLSFLTLPLGTIVRALKKHYGDDQETRVKIGSLTTLYDGLSTLDNDRFWTKGCKDILLNPASSFKSECRKLKLDISDSQTTDYFTCKTSYCAGRNGKFPCLSMYYDTFKCYCGKTMQREAGQNESQSDDAYGGVFTLRTSFIISDDLHVFPNTTGSIQTLRHFGINDTDLVEPMNVTFGFNEIMDLLKGSLLSQTPLSEIVLNKRQVENFSGLKYEPGFFFHDKEKDKEATSNSEKMVILKVIFQKSTNKILYAEADEAFVDFLCILLTIPLGGAESLLSSNACLKSIDNLYKSLENINGDKYLATRDTKKRLMKPKLPHGYIAENPILPLSEESFSPMDRVGRSFSSANFVKGQGKYIRGSQMYKISDDLTVTPLCVASTVSFLKGLNIHLSDVEELDIEIGMEEALSILKASLTSTTALNNGLKSNPMLMKQPKQEH